MLIYMRAILDGIAGVIGERRVKDKRCGTRDKKTRDETKGRAGSARRGAGVYV